MPKNPRDHGYDVSAEADGTPIVKDAVEDTTCPHCKCETVYLIEVPVVAPPQLRVPPGKRAYTAYVGCPACPWASPAMITAR